MATAPPSSAVPASENKLDMPKGTANATPQRPHALLLPLLFLTHILHLASSLIVLILAAYLSAHFGSSYAAYEMRAQGHAPFWTTLAAIDLVLMLPLLVFSMTRSTKSYLASIMLVLGIFWLIAFILALNDFVTGKFGLCDHMDYVLFNGGVSMFKCKLKKALVAFTFFASLTSLFATFLHWVSRES